MRLSEEETPKNKTELVAAMAKETNLSKKDVEDVLKSFVDVVSKELKNGG